MNGKTAKASRRQLRRALDPAIMKALNDHAMALRDAFRRIADLEKAMNDARKNDA